jgi:hypothetical protein
MLAMATPTRAAYHIVNKIAVGGDSSWDYLEPDPIGRRLYVTHKDKLTVVGDIPDSPGMGGVAIARDLNRGCTANGAEDMIGVFDHDTLKPVAKWKATGPIKLPMSPLHIAYSVSIAVVHEDASDKFSLVETVTTEVGASKMAVDTKTHRLFLPSADFIPAPPATADNPKPRRTMVPGSFRVLVLEP